MKYFLLHQVIRDWKTQGFACQQLECRSFIIKHFQIAHFSPRSAPSISRPEKRFIFPTVDDSSALERLWMAAPNAIQLKPLPVYQENTNQFSQELNGIHPTIYLINPEPRQKRQTQNKQKKADGEKSQRKERRGLHAINHYFSSLLLRSHSRQNFQSNLSSSYRSS